MAVTRIDDATIYADVTPDVTLPASEYADGMFDDGYADVCFTPSDCR